MVFFDMMDDACSYAMMQVLDAMMQVLDDANIGDEFLIYLLYVVYESSRWTLVHFFNMVIASICYM